MSIQLILILIYNIIMGNICKNLEPHLSAQLRMSKKDPQFQLPNWQMKGNIKIKQDISKVQKYFVSNDIANKYGNYILTNMTTEFQDKEYQQQKSVRLSKIHNNKSNRVRISGGYKSENIVQQNQQYSYLAAIFCFIAEHQQIISKIFATTVNPFGFYLLKLFPTGKQALVLVDDKIPFNQDIQYSSTKKFQIWPYMLQKSWAKLIGSYEKAKGLSPEDAFEQILGAPSYSYRIDDFQIKELKQKIVQLHRDRFCIMFIAAADHFLQGQLLQRQVFYLLGQKKIKNRQYWELRSPYINFNFTNRLSQLKAQPGQIQEVNSYYKNNPGNIIITNDELLKYFQFCTIGYLKQNYISSVVTIKCQENQQLYYSFSLAKKTILNIRIIQFYEQYLINNKNYEYTPVFLKLYHLESKSLISEGCGRSAFGTKSSNVFQTIFEQLQAGNYILKLEIDWIFAEKVSTANIIFYSPIAIQIEKKNKFETKQIIHLINRTICLEQQSNQLHNLRFNTKWLKNGVFMMLQNISLKEKRIKINLKNSQNLIPVHSNFINKIIELDISPESEVILQLRKQKMDQISNLGSYTFELTE